MFQEVAGIKIPDSRLAKEAADLLREHGDDLFLPKHSVGRGIDYIVRVHELLLRPCILLNDDAHLFGVSGEKACFGRPIRQRRNTSLKSSTSLSNLLIRIHALITCAPSALATSSNVRSICESNTPMEILYSILRPRNSRTHVVESLQIGTPACQHDAW